jgi:predicted PurR-regulated permease PerM
MNDDQPSRRESTIKLDPRNVWQIGFVILGVVAVALFVQFVLEDGGSVIFSLLMAWFASVAMEPAVRRFANRMRRGVATFLVMLLFVVFMSVFFWAFGALFIDQIAQLLKALPDLVDEIIKWVNQRFNSNYQAEDVLTQLNITPSDVAGYASQVVGGLLGLLGSIVGSFFGLFTFALFTFYFSADGPRFRMYFASLFPQRIQPQAMQVWSITQEKVGGYVAARVILAAINGSTTALVFYIIGMPSWLALGVWVGIVAQFVPTIGTYIAVVFPAIVGFLSPNPWIGVMALAWALIYQQIENLTLEPKISARAVNVHPAVAFASVMLGAALFGVAGALLAVPVCAMFIAIGEANSARHTVRPDVVATLEGESS